MVDTPKHKDHKKNYNKNVPLSGGIYLFIAIAANILMSIYHYESFVIALFIFFFLILGIYTDLKSDFEPKIRLLFQTILTLSLVITLDLKINNTGIFFLNYFIGNSIFNLIFTSFCILILLNGSNLCDGVNCNVMGYYLILCTAIMLSDLSTPSAFLQIEIIVNIFFIFYIFNLFKKYFLGDSGVYVISIFMAVYIIQFINLNTTASPLIALNLLWYPAFENLFSIIRRLLTNKKIQLADRNHLHILLFENLKKNNNNDLFNSLSGIILNMFMSVGIFFSIKYYYNNAVLLTILLMNVTCYLIFYFYFLQRSLNLNKKHIIKTADKTEIINK